MAQETNRGPGWREQLGSAGATTTRWLPLLLLFLATSTPAAPLRISIVSIDETRRPTLALTGLETGQYAIEMSTNLSAWQRIAGGRDADGGFRFVHAEAAGMSSVYYRGRAASDATGPVVVPQVDSGAVAVGVITPESGGRLALRDAQGTRYTFTVGPSNVVAPVAISMQVVTNFAAFPETAARRSAVVFTPDGFSFHGAGLLEITFPEPVPSLKLSSYSFGGTGGDFHLVPDLVSSNRVSIPVTHFSGVGAALWEPNARTHVILSSIDDQRSRVQHDLGSIIARERERALLGLPPQTDFGAELELRSRDYFDRVLRPLFGQAETNCALARYLTVEILGLARQGDLLGWTNNPASEFFESGSRRTWSCNCLKEALTACDAGNISDHTLVRTVLGFDRESQLAGGGDALDACGFGSLAKFIDRVQADQLPCRTEWQGLVTYADGGTEAWNCGTGNPDETCAESTGTALSIQAEVEKVDYSGINTPFFSQQVWTLVLVGEATGAVSHEKDEDLAFECGKRITDRWRRHGTSSGRVALRLDLGFINGVLMTFVASQSTPLTVAIDSVHSRETIPCSGGPDATATVETSATQDSHGLYAGEVRLSQVQLTESTTGSIRGIATGTHTSLHSIAIPFRWTFELRRRP